MGSMEVDLERQTFEPDSGLFCRYELVSCVFVIYPEEARLDKRDNSLASTIIDNGGWILREPGRYGITLVDENYANPSDLGRLAAQHDLFNSSFIYDSVKQRRVLDLNKYRLTQEKYDKYNANDVLRKRTSWADLTPKRIRTPSRRNNNGTVNEPPAAAATGESHPPRLTPPPSTSAQRRLGTPNKGSGAGAAPNSVHLPPPPAVSTDPPPMSSNFHPDPVPLVVENENRVASSSSESEEEFDSDSDSVEVMIPACKMPTRNVPMAATGLPQLPKRPLRLTRATSVNKKARNQAATSNIPDPPPPANDVNSQMSHQQPVVVLSKLPPTLPRPAAAAAATVTSTNSKHHAVPVPDVSAFAVPDVPAVSVPDVPAFAVPDVPAVSVPDIPAVPVPAINKQPGIVLQFASTPNDRPGTSKQAIRLQFASTPDDRPGTSKQAEAERRRERESSSSSSYSSSSWSGSHRSSTSARSAAAAAPASSISTRPRPPSGQVRSVSPIQDINEDDFDDVPHVPPPFRRVKGASYSFAEGQRLLNVIMEQKWYAFYSGTLIYKWIETRGLFNDTGRTYQSLKNHFLRTILPNLTKYQITRKQRRAFAKGAERIAEGKKEEAHPPVWR